VKLAVNLKKEPDLITFMPFGSIHVKMDNVTPQCFQHMPEHCQESLTVTSGGADEAFLAQKRGYPAGQIEPAAMLTGSRHFEPLTSFGPATSQARMQAKAGLVLKNDGLIVFQLTQFFLTPGENDGRPWHALEDKHNWLFSDCNPDNATSIGPDVPLALRQIPSSGEPPEWGRPSQLSPAQIQPEIFPGAALIVYTLRPSVALAVLAGVEVLATGPLSDLLRESSDPESCGLARTKRLSIPDAGPPRPAIRPQSSVQSRPPGFAWPGLIAFLGLLQAALYLKLSYLKHITYLVNVPLSSAFVLAQR